MMLLSAVMLLCAGALSLWLCMQKLLLLLFQLPLRAFGGEGGRGGWGGMRK